jgi:hypothetical protein
VATKGLRLSPEDQRAFRSEVRQLVQERLAGMSPEMSEQPLMVCGCPGCCWPPDGRLGDLTTIDPLPFPAREDEPISVALYFKGDGLFIKGDTILFQIWIDPRGGVIPPDQILVGLRIDAAQDPDQWAKEITGWTICQCAVQTDHQESATANYKWMWINRATVDTLAFRKAVFLGWHNSGYLGPTRDEFWNLLGGLVLTFDWLQDDW